MCVTDASILFTFTSIIFKFLSAKAQEARAAMGDPTAAG